MADRLAQSRNGNALARLVPVPPLAEPQKSLQPIWASVNGHATAAVILLPAIAAGAVVHDEAARSQARSAFQPLAAAA